MITETHMTTTMIGGEVCSQPLAWQLLSTEPRALTRAEIDGLCRIFVAIGQTWNNTVHDSAGLKSSWLEFVAEKTLVRPSYVAEYVNALEAVEELIALYGEPSAFQKLFLDNGIPPNSLHLRLDSGILPPYSLDTRLAHAKYFVVDEFIRVQVVAGGFKNFIRPHETEIRPENIVNYNSMATSAWATRRWKCSWYSMASRSTPRSMNKNA
jgi:hypothetical protein